MCHRSKMFVFFRRFELEGDDDPFWSKLHTVYVLEYSGSFFFFSPGALVVGFGCSPAPRCVELRCLERTFVLCAYRVSPCSVCGTCFFGDAGKKGHVILVMLGKG